jgi:glycosyltransferase involved in cell wall biosynthesis
MRRRLLRLTERVSCGLADRVLCVSHSVRAVAADEHLGGRDITVLRGGSINGVDATGRFNPERCSGLRESTRRRLDIPLDAQVVGFVGRIVRDKGVVELADAWHQLRASFPRAHLLILGWFEPQDPVPKEVRDELASDERVHLVGGEPDTPQYFAAMDVVALPTYREGFPVVPLEAASMALPVVATMVPGVTDAVVDNVTGTLVPPRDARALAEALAHYLRSPALRRDHGQAARSRVLAEFRPVDMWNALRDVYMRALDLDARRIGS